MTLPYVRTINYLSPSALVMLEERPVEFYLRRLGPREHEPPREEQGFPAAVGIAFDAMVKERVAKECLLRCPTLDFMLHEVTHDRERSLTQARELMAGYERSGALRRLLEERPTCVAQDWEDFAPGTKVPIRTRVDCLTEYGGRPRVHDWKTAGANRPGTRSPSQGYAMTWDTDSPGVPSPAHAKYGLPLDALDPQWATQITMYGWAQGFPISEDVVGSIDEVIPWGGGRVRVAQFRSRISVAFQQGVRDRLVEAWRRIECREVVPVGLTLDELRVML